LELGKADLVALLDYLEERLRIVLKAKNCAISEVANLSQQFSKTEHKVHNIKKESGEIEWGSEQLRKQNNQIEELNKKLVVDLEGVKKHLNTLEKINKVIQK
jgi:predicted ArsR family transcriptional regulator